VSIPGSALADRIRAGDRVRLLFLKMPCPADVEIAAHAGFDGVILDTEHGPPGAVELEHHLRAADAAGIPALVRVGSLSPPAILTALDAGATGIVIPHVKNTDEAADAVQAAHYPPRGRRGLALSTRAGRYGALSVLEHLKRAREQTLVIVQIEDAPAVPRARESLAVDGIDGVLIGATDLSISLGHPGEPAHPEVAAAVADIREAARTTGVAAATVVANPAQATEWFGAGGSVAVFVASQLTSAAFAAAAAPDDEGPRARTLILLPGMLGTDDLWAAVADRLRERIDVRHARIDLDDSIQEMAETVLATAPPRFALAGHSLGGIVALTMAQRAPGRVERLALLNMSARPGTDESHADSWQRMRQRTKAGEFDTFAAKFARESLAPRRRHEQALIDKIEAMAHRVGRAGFLRQLTAQETRPDNRTALPATGCPTLVIAGVEDEVAPPALQEELAAAIPGARLERIEGCGHMSPLEAPERVAQLLLDWTG